MVKCKVIVDFYDNVESKARKIGEEFECLEERAEYLSGKNKLKLKVVDVIEVIPLKDENEPIKIGKKKLPKVIQVDENVSRETTEEKPKKKGRKKIDTEE